MSEKHKDKRKRPALALTVSLAAATVFMLLTLYLIPARGVGTHTDSRSISAAVLASPVHEDPSAATAGSRTAALSWPSLRKSEILSMPLPAGVASSRMIPGVISRGSTLAAIFSRHGISPLELDTLCRDIAPHFDPSSLKPGHEYQLWIDDDRLVAFTYQLDDESYLLADRPDESVFRAQTLSYPFIWENFIAKGRVDLSFYRSAAESGITIEAAQNFVEIFSWDVDFMRDLRSGDEFRLMLRRKRLLGWEKYAGSEILATSFTCGGSTLWAVRFQVEEEDEPEYFDRDGNSMRKEFLKAPLAFTRISSRYSRSRLHPVHRRRMPHWGVDYAAPVGTPVVSTADGTVTMAGWDRGGGGKTIKIRHNDSISTAYLHLSRFASGIKRGTRIRQGQVIGFVGTTGVSSGPHLDYRVKIDGSYRNPLTLKFPPARAVPEQAMSRFKEECENLMAICGESDSSPAAG